MASKSVANPQLLKNYESEGQTAHTCRKQCSRSVNFDFLVTTAVPGYSECH